MIRRILTLLVTASIFSCGQNRPQMPVLIDDGTITPDSSQNETYTSPTREVDPPAAKEIGLDSVATSNALQLAEAAVSGFEPYVASVGYSGTPMKGENFSLVYFLKNRGSIEGEVTLDPMLSADSIDGFQNVRSAQVKIKLAAGATKRIDVRYSSFIQDSVSGQRFGIQAGKYWMPYTLTYNDKTVSSRYWYFYVRQSNAILTLLIYEPALMKKYKRESAIEFMNETLNLPTALESKESGELTYYKGFDDFMGTRHKFDAVECELCQRNDEDQFVTPRRRAKEYLKMDGEWASAGTSRRNHGYDYYLLLTNKFGGGVQSGNQAIARTGWDIIDQRDIIQHEIGHIFGAGHTPGRYVMHPSTLRLSTYTWKQVSRDQMKNRFDIIP